MANSPHQPKNESKDNTNGQWRAIRDTYADRKHRREAVARWVEKRAEDDLWIVEAPDGSTALVGGEEQARRIADAVNGVAERTDLRAKVTTLLKLVTDIRERVMHADDCLALTSDKAACLCGADKMRRDITHGLIGVGLESAS